MNFLHVIQRYWPYTGGAEYYFQEISERLVREGHTVSLYTTDAFDLEHFWSHNKRRIEAPAELHNGVAIRRFPVRQLPGAPLAYPIIRRAMTELARIPVTTPLLFSASRFTPYIPALDRALDTTSEKFELVHAANISLDSVVYAAYRLARRQRIPFVITPFTHLGEPQNQKIRKYYTMPHQIKMLRDAYAVIVQTELERAALSELGVSRERMHRVGMGVNPDDLRGGDGARFRAKHQINEPIVLFLGTAAYDKGAMHLIEAMDQLWSRGRAVSLVIAGPTMGAFDRFFAAQSERVKEHTRLLGFVPPDQHRNDLLAAADIFAMPSRTDSFGIVYLEAWLYNKPVIGARAGGVPEVIEHERDGFLVNFGDVPALAARVEQLLDDPALAQRIGCAGHDKVLRELTWDKKYAQVKAIYNALGRNES